MKQKSAFLEKIPMEARPGVRYWVPAAAMDETDFREEIRQLYARGFGRIELVVLSGRNPELDRSEDGWGTENWDRMVRIAADETEKLGMKLDIANGPGWPISSPVIKDADDPAALRELTYGEFTLSAGTHYEGPLPERKTVRPEGTPKLVAVMAYPEVSERILKQSGYIDLSAALSPDGKSLCFDLPEASEGTTGQYRIFAFYEQPAVHKINSGMNYVIDHLGKAGVEACKAYWDPIFEKYDYPSMESFFCDSLEYVVTLEWTPGFETFFEEKYGYDLRPFLPVVGEHPSILAVPEVAGCSFEDPKIGEMVNREFMEALTYCYCENHLRGLEEMANAYGKTIRYQVAYNKPFEEEISALYPGIPENEALGRPTFDGMKDMAAAAHLGRKKRYSFECAAEFGFGYNQTYEDLLWWIKRAQMAGMNAQVMHGASYSGAYYGSLSENGRVPGAEWPGYEGFGKFVSNNWNRTLSIEDARKVLDRIARTNRIFLGTKKVDAAILRSDYTNTGDGGEGCFYNDGGKLQNAGFSYEFVCESLLKLPVCRVKDGVLDPEGPAYRALIVMPGVELSLEGIRTLRRLQREGLPVVLCEERYPCRFYSDYADEKRREEWEEEFAALLSSAKEAGLVSMIEDVPETLLSRGIGPRIRTQCSHDLITAVHETEDCNFYILYANNRVEFDWKDLSFGTTHVSGGFRPGTTKNTYERPGDASRSYAELSIESRGPLFVYDPWNNSFRPSGLSADGTRVKGGLWIEEDEMLILAEDKTGCQEPAGRKAFAAVSPASELNRIPIRFERLQVNAFEPEKPEEYSFLRSRFSAESRTYIIEKAEDFAKIDPELEHFAGKGTYSGSFTVEKKDGIRYMLKLGKAADTLLAAVNGQEVEGLDQVFRRADITDLIADGRNLISVRVMTNLHARLTKSFDPKDYEHTPFCPPSMEHRSGLFEEPGFPIGVEEYSE